MTTKPRRYAEGTSVSVDKTKAELDSLLQKHGACQRMFATDDDSGRAIVTFRLDGRTARLELHVDVADRPRGWIGWTQAQRDKWMTSKHAQAEREAWRRLLLLTKAKLEFVADGTSTFEREFLANILLPNGATLYDEAAPKLAEAYENGSMPQLLPPPGGNP